MLKPLLHELWSTGWNINNVNEADDCLIICQMECKPYFQMIEIYCVFNNILNTFLFMAISAQNIYNGSRYILR